MRPSRPTHRTPRAGLILAVLAATAFIANADAQAPTFIASATKYATGGEMMGQQMDPWEANWVVRDTMIDGKKAVAITHNTIRIATVSTFSSTTLLDPASGRVLKFFGNDGGRAPGAYALRLSAGRLQGTSEQEGAAAVPLDLELPESSIPASAVPFVLAARTLKDGDSVAIHVFTFQASTNHIFQYDFVGTVRSGSFQRAAATAAEPVWIVSGRNGYLANFTIAKGDRRVLQMVFPQGTVGTETNTFTGLITP